MSAPAFPQAARIDGWGKEHIAEPGMTLRDYFAAQALSGLLARSSTDVPHCDTCRPVANDAGQHYADIAYRYADAMLAERSK